MPDISVATTLQLFPCLGVKAFGLCGYNPTAPFSVYFSLGEVIGALGFTLAVQQLLKPIYVFRLSARYLNLWRLYGCVSAGVLAVLIAAIVPNIPSLHDGPLGYAIVWEIVATILFAVSYGAVVLAVILPVRARPSSLVRFCQSSASLLSSAGEADHIDYAFDLQRSLPVLIKAASFADHLGQTSAFFDFAFRRQIEQASYAHSFLRIIADASFCATMVRRLPWRVARMLHDIAEQELHSRGAVQFVRELANQAILRDDGMMAREVGYHGFGTAPILSDSLFADMFLLRAYNPMELVDHLDSDLVTPRIIKRFNSAAERCLTTIIASKDVYQSSVAHSIQRGYQSIFMKAWSIQESDDHDFHLTIEMHHGVQLAIKQANNLLTSASPRQYAGFFVVNENNKYRHDVLEDLVDIVYEALCAVANRFKGVDDPFWFTVHDTFHRSFPSIGEQPDGLTPFQQRLALRIIEKLQENMKGFYPAISRVLLACVGPYEHKAGQLNRTAFNILKDAVYIELKNFPLLAAEHPEKFRDYLPDNLTFDLATTRLTHTYRGGEQVVTDLSSLKIEPIALLAEHLRRAQPTKQEEWY